jgi:hypothetical protein
VLDGRPSILFGMWDHPFAQIGAPKVIVSELGARTEGA